MNSHNWSFQNFSKWLSAQSSILQNDDFTVELHHNSEFRPSIRLKAERRGRIGELTVWEDRAASEAVIDLESGDFVYMRDGTTLGNNWESQLSDFMCSLNHRVV